MEHMLVVLGAEHARDGRHGDTRVDLLGEKVACKLKGGRRSLYENLAVPKLESLNVAIQT